MNIYRLVLPLVLLLSYLSVYSQELPAIDAATETSDTISVKESPPEKTELAAISSTGTGGLWNSPSTWAGGIVPGAADNVTIIGGSAVIIDADITVGNITVGDGTLNPGILTFDPLTARSFTVNGDLIISGGISMVTTPSTGNITGHTITIGGNLTNGGIVDLSTNGNTAGAGLIFKNASNNMFSGGGPVANIRTITIDKGTTRASTLTLSVLNFTVQGSSTDTAASAYLTLTNGTLKISGLFAGNHRTFSSASYSIPATAGFWLDNPNYTVTAQNGSATVDGLLRISKGTYNVGTAVTDLLSAGLLGVEFLIEGGNINIAGAMRRNGPRNFTANYKQSGGIVTTCIAGSAAPCFDLTVDGSGGSLVIQAPAAVPAANIYDFEGFVIVPAPTAGMTVQFGNASTSGTGLFTADPFSMPNVKIDTTSGPHTVRLASTAFFAVMRNVDIGAGATLNLNGLQTFYMTGDTFINNGTLQVAPTSEVYFSLIGATASALNVNYSGTGSFSGPVNIFLVGAANMTFDAGVNSIRARSIRIKTAQVTNTGRLILGMGDATASTIQMEGTAAFDTAPVFDLGTGGQRLIYEGSATRSTGPELNPTRSLVELRHNLSNNTVTIAGGDITLNGPLTVGGVIDTGANKINHLSGAAARSLPSGGSIAYIKGTIIRRFTTATAYTFFVGDNQYSPVIVTPTALPSGPADVSVSAHDTTLAGLPPATSVSFSWDITQTGAMTSNMGLTYDALDVNGNPANYRAWKSANSSLSTVTSSVNTTTRTVTAPSLTDLTGGWGIGAVLIQPVSISGTIYAAGGVVPLRNAIVRLSGGNLTTPLFVTTGSLGTYSFQGISSQFEYTILASAKRHRFTPSSQTLTPTANVTGLDFIANSNE